MNWTKTWTKVTAECRTVVYQLDGTDITVESRLRHIEHANRSGTWDYTMYHVLRDGVEVTMKARLSEAKRYAERMCAG